MAHKTKVQTYELATRFDSNQFPFETTAEVEKLTAEIIGQDKAVRAMNFGLKVKQEGYHLFLVGPTGTGKTTYAHSKVLEHAKELETPSDWVYVYNFQTPDRPIAIPLPPGKGVIFQRHMERLLEEITIEIDKALTSKQYEFQKADLIQLHGEEVDKKWEYLEEIAYKERFLIEKSETGIAAIPLNDREEPHDDESYHKLTKEEQQEIIEKTRELNKELSTIVRAIQSAEKVLDEKLEELEKSSVYENIHFLVKELQDEYASNEKVVAYLTEVEKDVIASRNDFHEQEKEEEDLMSLLSPKQEKKDEHRYQVNVFVNHNNTDGAPVVHESNPTYGNLFGKFEYKGSFGTVVTNFTLMKPGAFHISAGGYCIIQASELVSNPYSWLALKRMMKTGELRIENPLEETGVTATSGLKPEPIPVQTKLILIGTHQLYHILSEYDEDFGKYFKVKVDFDVQMERNVEHCMKYASFVASYCANNDLRHFTRDALARVIDYSTRLAEDQSKLSTSFHHVTEILVEANFWADEENSQFVEKSHVRKALKERFTRNNLIEEKIKEMIDDGTIMIKTDGEVVGQINGLSVLNTGGYSFGQPNKITARTYIGPKGIVNIDRESYLSGPIHAKGLMILTGFIQGEFAQDGPLPLSASITFEQSYDMIDGDSASSTELYAILSSLSNIPIKQGIAVTGSVNQWGEIQPIGGVNEKIEGFFYTCKARGFTGGQGVIIPIQNKKNLMLRNEVIEAIEKGLFTIWAVSTISEGIEILTGITAGERDQLGKFEEGTVFHRVEKRLHTMISTFRRGKVIAKEKV
ncbi:Lon protease family protein [Bacillus sp. FJAT-45350]|uniref:Lon protease family protein n=1 Tax=Bacillus sp. FJAT-45350 TaxID=2011014 RepID=UPI000BB7038F|nr:ATP-binding protein [Bacillus sp. FJAT-45350]